MGEVIAWLNQNGTAVQALATVVLVVVTGTYAVFAWRQAEAMEASAQAAREAAEANERISQLRQRQECEERLDRLRYLRKTARPAGDAAGMIMTAPGRIFDVAEDKEEGMKYTMEKEKLFRMRKAGRRLGAKMNTLVHEATGRSQALKSKQAELVVRASINDEPVELSSEEEVNEVSHLAEEAAHALWDLADAAESEIRNEPSEDAR